MKKIIAKYKLNEYEINNLKGKFAEKKHFDTIIDYDCEVYNRLGEPVLFFVKNYIPETVLNDAYESMEISATPSLNRGVASGGVRSFGILKTGKKSKMNYPYIPGTNKIAAVNSGVAGYFDRSAHYDFCRTTAFNKKHLERFDKAMPLIKTVDKGFREFVPDRYKKQKHA